MMDERQFVERIDNADVPFLIGNYRLIQYWPARVEVLDALGKLNLPEANVFLIIIGASRCYYLEKYYAMRNLIDNGVLNWCLPARNSIKSDFYESLRWYEKFRRGEIKMEGLKAYARTKKKRNGDHWDWMLQL